MLQTFVNTFFKWIYRNEIAVISVENLIPDEILRK